MREASSRDLLDPLILDPHSEEPVGIDGDRSARDVASQPGVHVARDVRGRDLVPVDRDPRHLPEDGRGRRIFRAAKSGPEHRRTKFSSRTAGPWGSGRSAVWNSGLRPSLNADYKKTFLELIAPEHFPPDHLAVVRDTPYTESELCVYLRRRSRTRRFPPDAGHAFVLPKGRSGRTRTARPLTSTIWKSKSAAFPTTLRRPSPGDGPSLVLRGFSPMNAVAAWRAGEKSGRPVIARRRTGWPGSSSQRSRPSFPVWRARSKSWTPPRR